jgi:AcrR family transcriptional regulator
MQSISSKYTQLLATAQALFLLHGIRRVTIEEICRKAKVSKVTFYKYFKNRVDLALTVLTQILNNYREQQEAIFKSRAPFSARLKKMICLEHETINAWGPALIEDLMDPQMTEIQTFITIEQAKSIQAIQAFLAEGYASGVLNPDIPAEIVFYLLDFSRDWFNEKRFKTLESDPVKRAHLLTTLLMTGICQNTDSADV